MARQGRPRVTLTMAMTMTLSLTPTHRQTNNPLEASSCLIKKLLLLSQFYVKGRQQQKQKQDQQIALPRSTATEIKEQ